MILHSLADFLLSSWLWGMTFDLGHILLSALIMTCIFWFFLKRGLLISIGTAFLLQGGASILHTAVVVGLLIHLLHWDVMINLDMQVTPSHALCMCMGYGILYAVLESILLIFASFICNYRLFSYLIAVWASSLLAAIISYGGMRIFMWSVF
jgi:hypothetical protein